MRGIVAARCSPDVILVQEARVTAMQLSRRGLAGYQQFAVLVLDGRAGGGLMTFVGMGIAPHVAFSEQRALVVELSEMVPPLRFANVYRSQDVDTAAEVGEGFFAMVKAISGSAARDGTWLVVAGDFDVGNITSSTQRCPLVFPRCASASLIGRLDMETWLVEEGLTVVSGVGCAASDAVARWPSALER